MTRRQKVARSFFAAWCAANIIMQPATQIATMGQADADIPLVSNVITLSNGGTGTTTPLQLTGQSICWVATNAASTLSGGGVINPQVSSNFGNDWQTATTVSGGSITLAAGALTGIGNIAVLGATNFRLNVSGTVSGTGSVTYGCSPSIGGLTFNGTVGISGTVPISGSVTLLSGTATVGNIGGTVGLSGTPAVSITSGAVGICTSAGATCITPVQAASGTTYSIGSYQNSTGFTVPIACNLTLPLTGTSATQVLISAVGGKTTYLCGYTFSIGSTASAAAQLVWATSGTSCTGTLTQTSAKLTNGAAGVSAEKITWGGALGVIDSSSTLDLCVSIGGTVSLIGSIRYAQF